MTSVHAASIRLSDQTWVRLALLTEAMGCDQSRIIQSLCDEYLPQFESKLPGNILDDESVAGKFQRLKERAQDIINRGAQGLEVEVKPPDPLVPGCDGEDMMPLGGDKS